ncbi:MAG: hypothetical protein KDM91_12200 [Verrucomicrobiae bacterium]|nr:hypothetical protein [Verrucomicrobiae bacterium]MCP5541248.1 hypothetical protein [Akkermansiaceae bacterium]
MRPLPLPAQEEGISPVEAKLREALRNALVQARNVEAERARLDAELTALKVQSDAKIKDLTAKLDTALKRADSEKAAADQAIAKQKETIAGDEARIVSLEKSLDQWKTSHEELTRITRATEAERAKFERDAQLSRRLVGERERQNIQLYNTGKEILKRYKDYAFGRSLLAREPFTGLTKVKLEQLVQDYDDKIEDNRAPVEDSGKKRERAANEEKKAEGETAAATPGDGKVSEPNLIPPPELPEP